MQSFICFFQILDTRVSPAGCSAPLLSYLSSCSSTVVVVIWAGARTVGLIDDVIATLCPSHSFPLAGHGNTKNMTHTGQSH